MRTYDFVQPPCQNISLDFFLNLVADDLFQDQISKRYSYLYYELVNEVNHDHMP